MKENNCKVLRELFETDILVSQTQKDREERLGEEKGHTNFFNCCINIIFLVVTNSEGNKILWFACQILDMPIWSDICHCQQNNNIQKHQDIYIGAFSELSPKE